MNRRQCARPQYGLFIECYCWVNCAGFRQFYTAEKKEHMFDLFKKNPGTGGPADVKMIRGEILQEVKEQLKKMEGGEGGHIRGIQVFVAAADEEKHLYESALYTAEGDRFREEVQRIADDFAIDLPGGWSMETLFVEALPAAAVHVAGTRAAVFIVTRRQIIRKSATAYIKVRIGEAEQAQYTITSDSGKICIGREKKVQTADGFYRENNIAFSGGSSIESNRYISRQHAHIEFDPESGQFFLYADEGGVPPRNKIKIRAAGHDQPLKLFTTHIGHPLQEGDQVLLGQSALIEFSYTPDPS